MAAAALHEPRSLRARRWIAAAVAVVAVHAGGAAIALMDPPDDEPAEDTAGSIVMELAPLAVATPVDSMDLAPGPLMEEALLTPPKAEKSETLQDIPPVEEAPLAPQPEVVLPSSKPTEEVKARDEPEQKQIASDTPVRTEAAPQTTAPPRIDAEQSAAAMPTPGASRKSVQGDVTWQKALMAHLGKFRRYPAAARARGTTGTATVAFTMDAYGKVIDTRLIKSSGSPVLDEEAVEVLRRASPLPAPDDAAAGGVLELNLPIQFRLR